MKRKWLAWLLAGTMILSNSAVVMAVDEVYVENADDVFGGYSVAAEPPVRRGESHLSGLTEPPLFSVYSYCA